MMLTVLHKFDKRKNVVITNHENNFLQCRNHSNMLIYCSRNISYNLENCCCL